MTITASEIRFLRAFLVNALIALEVCDRSEAVQRVDALSPAQMLVRAREAHDRLAAAIQADLEHAAAERGEGQA